MSIFIGTYRKGQGKVFVIAKGEKAERKNRHDVFIVDDRDADDPNMQILASYRIRRNAHKREIAELMLKFDRESGKKRWKRTLKSLVTEWNIHNFAYRLFYKRSHSADCDFNNADEGKNFFDFIGR